MKKQYDFIVIGAGSGGVRFARLMAGTGKKFAFWKTVVLVALA